MPSSKRRLRSTLHYLPIRAACFAAGVTLACAPAAQAQDTDEAANRNAEIDFASCAKPVYPQGDAQAGHQGTVTLGFLVDENGGVKDSKVTGSSGFMRLDQAAQTALMKCSFQPALENGKAVQKWTYVKYVWTLG
jgi:TonB family protein